MSNMKPSVTYPSLDLAFDWVRGVLERQSSTADALDAKTATIFSIGTAIFGLGLGIPLSILEISFNELFTQPLAWIVSITYVIIALSAIYSLWVRRYEQMDNPVIIREDFWNLPPSQFKTELLSHLEDAYEHNEAILLRKAWTTRLIVPAVAFEALFLVLFLGFAL